MSLNPRQHLELVAGRRGRSHGSHRVAAALGSIATAFLKVRHSSKRHSITLHVNGVRRPSVEGDHPANDSIWDDRAFWMMLMH